MMNHIWSVLCQDASVDKESNLLSLFSCFEQIEVNIDKTKDNGRAVVPISFNLVSFWSIDNVKGEKSIDLKIEIVDPEGKILGTQEKNIPVGSGWKRFRNITKINGLPVTTEGRYIFRVFQKDTDQKKLEKVAELPLDVKINYTMPNFSR